MKTVAAIKEKLKKLRAIYKDVKDGAQKSGNSRKPWKFVPYFLNINQLLIHRICGIEAPVIAIGN